MAFFIVVLRVLLVVILAVLFIHGLYVLRLVCRRCKALHESSGVSTACRRRNVIARVWKLWQAVSIRMNEAIGASAKLEELTRSHQMERVIHAARVGSGAAGCIVCVEMVNLNLFQAARGDIDCAKASWVLFRSAFTFETLLYMFAVFGYFRPHLLTKKVIDTMYIIGMVRLSFLLLFYERFEEFTYNCMWVYPIRIVASVVHGDYFLTSLTNILFGCVSVASFVPLTDSSNRLGVAILELGVTCISILVVRTIHYERRRADAMQLALQSMFESDNDASCICREDGSIVTATSKLTLLLQQQEKLDGLNLCRFGADDTEVARLRQFFDVARGRDNSNVQVLHTSLRPGSHNGFGHLVLGKPENSSPSEREPPFDLALYVVRFPRTGANAEFPQFLVGFKLDKPKDIIPASADTSMQAEHVSRHNITRVIQHDSRSDTRSASENNLGKIALPSFSRYMSSTDGSQSSKESLHSFWDALHKICGTNVRPNKDFLPIMNQSIERENVALGSEGWLACANRVAHQNLLSHIDERVDRSLVRVPNREQAAACLAAAMLSSQNNPALPLEVWTRIGEATGRAGFPPVAEEARASDWQREIWFRSLSEFLFRENSAAYAHTYEFEYIRRRDAGQNIDDDTGRTPSVADHASSTDSRASGEPLLPQGRNEEEMLDQQRNQEEMFFQMFFEALGPDTSDPDSSNALDLEL